MSLFRRDRRAHNRQDRIMKHINHYLCVGTGMLAGVFLYSWAIPSAQALPAGAAVVNGSGAISQTGSTLTVNQASNSLILDWQSFNVSAGEKVIFQQPSTQATVLNRVLGAGGSTIDGQIQANGRVFLVNPNGILFTSGAQVDVGGLVASTFTIADADFQNANYQFTGGGNGTLINQGVLRAYTGGFIVLASTNVTNSGITDAAYGTAALAAGAGFLMDIPGSGQVNVAATPSAIKNAIQNDGIVSASNGTVLLSAKATDLLLGSVINGTGVVEAQSVNIDSGVIQLDSGKIDTGNLALSAGQIKLTSTALKGSGPLTITNQNIGSVLLGGGGSNPSTALVLGSNLLGAQFPLIDIYNPNSLIPVTVRTVSTNADTRVRTRGTLTLSTSLSTSNHSLYLSGGSITTPSQINVDVGKGDLTIETNSAQIGNSFFSGTGNLWLRPFGLMQNTTIFSGSFNGSGLAIPDSWLVSIFKPGFSSLTIGRIDGTGAVQINGMKANSAVSLQTGGSIFIAGLLDMAGNNLVLQSGQSIGQTGTIKNVRQLSASAGSGNLSLRFDNDMPTLTTALGDVYAARGISLSSSGGLSLNGQITANTAGVAGEDITIRGIGTIAANTGAGIFTGSSGNIYLSTEGSGDFINRAGGSLFHPGGRWLVYSRSPLADDTGGLTYAFRHYGDMYSLNGPTSIVKQGNGFLYSITPVLTPMQAERVYGDGNDTIAVAYSGFLPGDDFVSAEITGTPNTNSGAEVRTASGTYLTGEKAVSYEAGSLGSGQGYRFASSATIPLTILRRPITVSADRQTKVYDAEPASGPQLTYQVGGRGLVGGDVLTGALVREENGEDVGTYEIRQGTLDNLHNGNYDITYQSSQYTIEKAPLLVTGENKTREYGSENPNFTAVFSGFKGKDGADQVTGLVFHSDAGFAANTGNYWIRVEGGTARNYDLSFRPGILTVSPAVLTYTAQPVSRWMGVPNPFFTGTLSGFKNGDSMEEALQGSLIFASSARSTDRTGNYPIFGGGLSSPFGNYVFAQASANAAALTITGPSPSLIESITAAQKDLSWNRATAAPILEENLEEPSIQIQSGQK